MKMKIFPEVTEEEKQNTTADHPREHNFFF
jgi:hypothetical protein